MVEIGTQYFEAVFPLGQWLFEGIISWALQRKDVEPVILISLSSKPLNRKRYSYYAELHVIGTHFMLDYVFFCRCFTIGF